MLRQTTILERVIDPRRGGLSQELAQYLLSLDFPKVDQDRYTALVEKSQEGTLSVEESGELDDFLEVNDFLAIVQSKARASLQEHHSAA